MKKLIILSLALALVATQTLGFTIADADKLIMTNECPRCDLKSIVLQGQKLGGAKLSGSNLSRSDMSGAILIGADLSGANLTGAVLRDAKIDFADFTNAKLCNTVMPDGQRIFKDC